MTKMKSSSGMNGQGKIIVIMALLIVVLSFVLVYSFVLRPVFTGYVTEKQFEAQDMVVSALVSQIQQNGYVQIPVGEETLVLVPYQEPTSEPALIE